MAQSPEIKPNTEAAEIEIHTSLGTGRSVTRKVMFKDLLAKIISNEVTFRVMDMLVLENEALISVADELIEAANKIKEGVEADKRIPTSG